MTMLKEEMVHALYILSNKVGFTYMNTEYVELSEEDFISGDHNKFGHLRFIGYNESWGDSFYNSPHAVMPHEVIRTEYNIIED